MILSGSQINCNYRKALALAAELLQQKLRSRGHDPFARQELFHNLTQSALADEQVITLLKSMEFNRAGYEPVVEAALDQVKKELFPDVAKRRFVSLEKIDKYLPQTPEPENEDAFSLPDEHRQTDIIALLKDHLDKSSYAYLKRYILSSDRNRRLFDAFVCTYRETAFSAKQILKIEDKIRLLQRLFPDGKRPLSGIADAGAPLTDAQIIGCYKNILCGIERFFPPYFLQTDAKERAAVILRYLIGSYLNEDPQRILEAHDSTFFIRYKIQNIYRLFNYSMNRALYNAFPGQIRPWMSSRTPEKYWQDENNRVNAIRWLTEDKLNLNPRHFKKPVFSRKEFAANGLSFLFATYYNSVSKALQAAYPQLEPWEVGNVPKSYWTENNSARAVRRMIEKNNWQVEQLPALYAQGALNRQAFSEAGLATLFEYRFSKNIYRAVAAAYPGRFERWEFGNVPAVYWSERQNVFYAARWIARNEGIDPAGITAAIRARRLNVNTLKKYSIGSRLKKLTGSSLFQLYMPFFQKEHAEILEELRIHKKIKNFIRRELAHPLVTFLFYGLYSHLVRQATAEYIFRLERLAKRRERYKF